jgi:hypothetical protein
MSSTRTSSRAVGDAPAWVRPRPGLKDLWRRAQHGWPESFPLFQFPNAPLLVALAGLAVTGVTNGSLHDYAHATFYGGLAVWAWLELTAGAVWPRRVLGAAAFVYVVVEVGKALGA